MQPMFKVKNDHNNEQYIAEENCDKVRTALFNPPGGLEVVRLDDNDFVSQLVSSTIASYVPSTFFSEYPSFNNFYLPPHPHSGFYQSPSTESVLLNSIWAANADHEQIIRNNVEEIPIPNWQLLGCAGMVQEQVNCLQAVQPVNLIERPHATETSKDLLLNLYYAGIPNELMGIDLHDSLKSCSDMATQLTYDMGEKYVNPEFESDSGDEMLAVHFDEKLFNKKRLSCPECQYTCNRSYMLKRHQLRHSNERPHKCHMCKYAAKKAFTLKVHINRRHANDTLSAHKVSEPSKVSKENQHIKRNSKSLQPVQYTCALCNDNSESLQKLKFHIRRHLIDYIQYRCDLCNQKFEQFPKVKKHILTHFSSAQSKSNQHHYMTRRASACSQNPRSDNSSEVNTASHACNEKMSAEGKDGTENKCELEFKKSNSCLFTCELCGFSHEMFNSLEEHLLRHLGRNILTKQYTKKGH